MYTSYLERHLELMLEADNASSRHWHRLTQSQQAYLRALWKRIDEFVDDSSTSLTGSYAHAFNRTKRWFVRVQERDCQYSRIRGDWPRIVRDMHAKLALHRESLANLSNFLHLGQHERCAYLYGGVKQSSSLDAKLFISREGNAVQRNELDLLDIVRFRIVTTELDSLLGICLDFWDVNFDDIIKCRNFYYHPRNNYYLDPYRAVHFVSIDKFGSPIEIQMVTQYRDAVSLLDHPFSFKKVLPFLDNNHEAWLKEFSMKATVMEFLEARGPC